MVCLISCILKWVQLKYGERERRNNKIMKKRIVALFLCAAMVMSLGACGKNGKTEHTTEQTTQETASEAFGGSRSAQIDLNLEKLVTKLVDYKGLDVTITGDYDVTDEQVEKNIMSLLPYYGITGVEVKDHDVVQKDDYVKIDYTGYLDGEAFDGGSAEDVMFDVANNYDVSKQTNYIDGFADGLIGAKVGGEASSDVTFPEDYQASNLAGKKVTFKFKIKGIYKAVTMDTLTDDMVANAFTEQKLTTKKDLIEYVRKVLENQASNSKSQAVINKVEDYLLDKCEVTVPDDYLEARLQEYQYEFEQDNCDDTQTLEQYAKNNNTTVEDLKKQWKTLMTEQIKVEFIFGRIAEKENITIDEDDFKKFTDYLVSSSSSQFSDENALYEYYGLGNKEDGEKTLRQLYIVNQAISYVVEKTNVTVEPETQTEEATE